MKLKDFVLPALFLSVTLPTSVAAAHGDYTLRVHGHHHLEARALGGGRSWNNRGSMVHGFPLGGTGLASWYGPGFGGHRTANGERFDGGAFTAAHRFLPFGARVLVTSRRTGRSVVVRINDRGPYVGGRVIDLTPAASQALGMSGTEAVTLARL